MRVLHMLSLETTMLLVYIHKVSERKLEIHLAFSEPPKDGALCSRIDCDSLIPIPTAIYKTLTEDGRRRGF
jgi:hypothetical protein